jgi:uncharacterized OB-fold protein
MLRTQPPLSALARPWFDACSEGRLLIQRCGACGHCQFYPRVLCTDCGAGDPAWIEAGGRGRVASFTIVRHAVSAAYDAPYIVALVDLEEGPRLMSNIVDCPPEALRIGAEVSVRFESWGNDISLPVFAPSGRAIRTDDVHAEEETRS